MFHPYVHDTFPTVADLSFLSIYYNFPFRYSEQQTRAKNYTFERLIYHRDKNLGKHTRS